MSMIQTNIGLQVITSRCLAAFKDRESRILADFSKYLDRFSPTSALLLATTFKVWFHWLMRFESKTTRLPNMEDACTFAQEDTGNVMQEILDIVMQDSSVSSEDSMLFAQTHGLLLRFFQHHVHFKDNTESTFIHVTTCLNDIMYNVLFELDEIHSLVSTNDRVFLSFDDICFEYKKVFGKCLLYDRAKIYLERKEIKEVDIKLYTPDFPDYVEEDLKGLGIEIVNIIR